MILDGDIIQYLEALDLDVQTNEDDCFTDFIFHLEVAGVRVRVVATLDHEENTLDVLSGFNKPKTLVGLADAMNEINMNSSMFKCYYDKGNNCIILESYTLVDEETVIPTIEQCIYGLIQDDVDVLENLTNTIYFDVEDDSEEDYEDEEDFDDEEDYDASEEFLEDEDYDDEEELLESIMDLIGEDDASDEECLDSEEDDYSDLESIDGVA